MADLSTLVRNTCRVPGKTDAPDFEVNTSPPRQRNVVRSISSNKSECSQNPDTRFHGKTLPIKENSSGGRRNFGLDELFRGFFVRPMDLHTGNVPANPPVIRMDVKEQENAYVVYAELPGVKKEDIHITVDGSLVSISAEVQNQNETKEGEQVLRSER
jgi:HSP20 family molecular chaperone IbpA